MIKKIKNQIQQVMKEPHMQEVARGTVLAFILKVFGAGLAFGFNVAVARILGAEGAGLYFLALSITTICSVIGRVGLDNAMLRFIASHTANNEWGKINAVYALGMKIAVIVSGTMTIIVYILSPYIAHALFNKPELDEPLRYMSLSILPFSLINVQAESLKALKSVSKAIFLQSISLPLISSMLLYLFISKFSVEDIIVIYVFATLISLFIGIYYWSKSTVHNNTSTFEFSILWSSCKHLFVVSLVQRGVLPWAPILLLGFWLTSEEVGVYSIATRVVALVSFLLVAINSVLAPKFSFLYSKGEIQSLSSVARKAAFFITIISSPIFCMIIFYGDYVLSMFGNEFERGVTVLIILAIGQLANVLCGSVGYLLMMSGNEMVFRNINIIMAFFQISIMFVTISIWGMIGAAITSAAFQILLNGAAVYYVQKILHIKMFSFKSGEFKNI